jgi:hypothetical protein
MSPEGKASAGEVTPAAGLTCEIGIGEVAGLDLGALRSHWHRLYGTAAPVHMSPALLRLAVAYRLQERRQGGLSPTMKMRLAQRVKASGSGSASACGRRAIVYYAIKPGTRFLREWGGRDHEVTAMADGRFEYRGTAYRSLSAIAREITGTRWSGPAFFGMRVNG